MTIFHINDDDEMVARAFRESVIEAIPGLVVRDFSDLLAASNAVGRCDAIVIDVSCVASFGMWHLAWSPIANFAAKRPGVPIIILSGLPIEMLRDTAAQVEDAVEGSKVFPVQAGMDSFQAVFAKLREVLA